MELTAPFPNVRHFRIVPFTGHALVPTSVSAFLDGMDLLATPKNARSFVKIMVDVTTEPVFVRKGGRTLTEETRAQRWFVRKTAMVMASAEITNVIACLHILETLAQRKNVSTRARSTESAKKTANAIVRTDFGARLAKKRTNVLATVTDMASA